MSYVTESCPPSDSVRSLALVAMRLALKYANRTPHPKELQDSYGMSRATAYRWVKAFRDAKGLP